MTLFLVLFGLLCAGGVSLVCGVAWWMWRTRDPDDGAAWIFICAELLLALGMVALFASVAQL